MDNFEKGKQLIIEGFEALLTFYRPYIKLGLGFRLLGLGDSFGVSDFDPSLTQIGLDTLMRDLRDAQNIEDIKAALKDNGKLWRRFE